MVDMSCCSSHATVRRSTHRVGDFCRQICFLQHQEGFLTMFWYNFRIHVFMTPLVPLQKRFYFLTMPRHSGIYFSPAVHTLALPSQFARSNLDSSEKSKQDPLSGTVPLRAVSEIGCALQAFRHSAHHGLWSSLDDHNLAIFAICQFPYTSF